MHPQLEYVLEQLRKHEHPYRKIAAACGIHPNTIRAIESGNTINPGINTVEALTNFFKSHET